jgi:hypothetical protein
VGQRPDGKDEGRERWEVPLAVRHPRRATHRLSTWPRKLPRGGLVFIMMYHKNSVLAAWIHPPLLARVRPPTYG